MPSPSNDYIFQFAAWSSPGGASMQTCFAARSSGLYRSKDGGQTWEPAYASLNTSEALATTSVALAPDFAHEPTIFAGLNGAILCSYDGGNSWQPGRLPAPLPAISALAISPCFQEDGTALAGTSEDGVLVTSDRGMNWVSWNFGLLDLNILCLAVSPEFAADETIFAGSESGLFRSTNGGRAWKDVVLPVEFDAVLSLAISPNFVGDNTVFVGTENQGLLVSHDRGKSWRLVGEKTASDPVNHIVLSASSPASELLILHGGALIVSKDGGETWKKWKKKLTGEQNVTAVLAPQGPSGEALIGLEDGRIFRD